MKQQEFKDGDVVKVSWKADEGGGWYSNVKQKRGVVHSKGKEWWVVTERDPRVGWSDITAISLVL